MVNNTSKNNKTIVMDGITIRAALINEQNSIAIVIPQKERSKIRNEYADCHWIGTKLFAVSEMSTILGGSLIMSGNYTDNPHPYFLEDL